ncbi:MAG: UDP-glucose 4-epimerase GalE [Phycisphaerales bacterium]|nr:UDP-glucose 4-epimerase GalE [Phycisphaerales bacterium]
MEHILVTGGAGYIGSHAVKALLAAGHRVTALDDFRRGHMSPLELLSAGYPGRLDVVEGAVADADLVRTVLSNHDISAVMHFAALAYVAESVDKPIEYFQCNVTGLIALLAECARAGITRFIFSSSCSVYGDLPRDAMPVTEDSPRLPVSPYGWTKLMGEQLLAAHAHAEHRTGRDFACTFLRYFNVAGADSDGVLGEDHNPETHLIPRAIFAALGRAPAIDICGTDFPTPDGTAVRDFIHVEDLVDAHLLALERAQGRQVKRYNIAIGKPYSVREVLEAVARVTGKPVPSNTAPRRPGDPAVVYADASLAKRELSWSPRHSALDDIVASAFHWFEAHADGYRS